MKSRTNIIVEIGQAHDGSLGILHSYIDAVSQTGADSIKFQVHIAEAESSPLEPFRVNFSYEDKTRFDYWRRMSFTRDQWQGVKRHCDDVGLEFLASPFSCAAVDLLESLNVTRYKVGSGEVSNYLMLRKIACTGKPIILSSGLSAITEIDEAIEFLRPFGNDISLLQCATLYPTPPEKLGLNMIRVYKNRYPDLTIGLSEHTSYPYAAIAAVAMGAEIIEFHTVFDRRMFGPDTSSSLEIDEVEMVVRQIRMLEVSLDNPVDKSDVTDLHEVKTIFEKSIAINKDLGKGHVLKIDDLEAKKPAGMGISAKEFSQVIGKRIGKDMDKWSFLQWNLLDNA